MNMMHMGAQRAIMDHARLKAIDRYRTEISECFDTEPRLSLEGTQGQGSLINVIGIEYAKAFEVASRGLMP